MAHFLEFYISSIPITNIEVRGEGEGGGGVGWMGGWVGIEGEGAATFF